MFTCVLEGCESGAADNTPNLPLLITAINAAHLPGTLAMEKNHRTSASRSLNLSWVFAARHQLITQKKNFVTKDGRQKLANVESKR